MIKFQLKSLLWKKQEDNHNVVHFKHQLAIVFYKQTFENISNVSKYFETNLETY